MSIYSKMRRRIVLRTIAISLVLVVAFWAVLFVTDYIMYKNNMPILFATTKVEAVNGTHIITENGLGYYVITNGNNLPELYLFGHKIK